MKIKVIKKDYNQVTQIKSPKHQHPRKQSSFFRKVMYLASKSELRAVDHEFSQEGMERLADDQPCLFLMNHSSFTDLQIAATYLRNRPYHIVCTNDGLVGKEKLMRKLGCIPTKKFIFDTTLVRDMKYTFDKLGSSILMYPEASYSFDGTETPLPDSLGKCIKLMKVPVVMIKTQGAFLRDPLYNCLQKRNVKVTTKVKFLLGPEQIEALSATEINRILAEEFHYDHFREQDRRGIRITESFRADGLHRVLYKCPHCLEEGQMVGKGITVMCKACGQQYQLLENGQLNNTRQDTLFTYVSDWYRWERECVKEEIQAGKYGLEADVNIKMLVDMKAIYDVGDGVLTHDRDGFTLTGCGGQLNYKQSSKVSYSLYADYYWYELGDMVCIGDSQAQYYCFPKKEKDLIVAKARLATEELYKYSKI